MTTLQNKIKATLFLENSMGLPIARQIWLYAYELQKRKNNAFKDDLIVHYTEKGKRRKVGFKLEKAMIVEGWETIEAFNTREDVNFISFDSDKFKTIANSLKNIIVKTSNI